MSTPMEMKALRLHLLTLLEKTAADCRLNMVLADELQDHAQRRGIEAAPAGVLTALNGKAPNVHIPPAQSQVLAAAAQKKAEQAQMDINNLVVLVNRFTATFQNVADPTVG